MPARPFGAPAGQGQAWRRLAEPLPDHDGAGRAGLVRLARRRRPADDGHHRLVSRKSVSRRGQPAGCRSRRAVRTPSRTAPKAICPIWSAASPATRRDLSRRRHVCGSSGSSKPPSCPLSSPSRNSACCSAPTSRTSSSVLPEAGRMRSISAIARAPAMSRNSCPGCANSCLRPASRETMSSRRKRPRSCSATI